MKTSLEFCGSEIVFNHNIIKKYLELLAIQVIQGHFIIGIFRTVYQQLIQACRLAPSQTLCDDKDHFTVLMTQVCKVSVLKSRVWTFGFSF